MDSDRKYFSYKKSIFNQLLKPFILILLVVFECFLGYIFRNKLVFNRDTGEFDPIRDDLVTFFKLRLENIGFIFLALIIALIILITSLYTLYTVTKILICRERVVLAKVVRMSSEIRGEFDDEISWHNTSLSKSLAKNFQQVIFHQIANNGKVKGISIYASKIGYLLYPKPRDIFHELSGICKTVGIKIERFSEQDYNS